MNRFFKNPFIYEPFFAKRFIIMGSFMGWFFYSPFVQQPEIYEPIYEPIYLRHALKQVPATGAAPRGAYCT